MAKKNTKPITHLGNADKLTVQKSLPLFALWRSDLTLAEFKILDTYLARIDSHKPDERAVIFEKGELEEKLGVEKINQKNLEDRLKHLMGNVVKIPDSDENNGFRLITLFDEAVAKQDDYGLWQVKLECTQKAMKYIFNIENLGYLRYKLRCVTSISSRYTYIMFVYLESHRFQVTWEEPLETLKEILNCDKEEIYKEFKRFNDRLLKRVQKEMHEKTECRYDYVPVKKGRSVVAIRFTVHTLTSQIPEIEVPEQLAFCSDDENALYKDNRAFLAGACESEFSDEEMDLIMSMLGSISLPKHEQGAEFAKYHYLAEKYCLLNIEAKKRKISNRFKYFVKMLDNDK